MAFKKVLFVLLVPVVVEVVIACCGECAKLVNVVYTNKSVSVSHLNNEDEYPVVVRSGPVSKKAYGLQVTMHGETVALNAEAFPSFFQ